MKRKNLLYALAAIMFGALLSLSGCSKKDKDDDDNGGAALSDEKDLEKVVYCLKIACSVAEDYNDKGLRPYSIQENGSTIASISYLPNGLLSYASVSAKGPITSTTIINFRTDVGRRPGSICTTSTPELAAKATASYQNASYDYENDPSSLNALFGGFMGSSMFNSLNKLCALANNDAITETLYQNMNAATPVNCYKLIVFGKNKEGKLIGKYVGFVLYNSFVYWSINPENSNFGKSATAVL